MYSYKQTLIVTHNDPKAMVYRKILLNDGWKIIHEDTGCATYEKYGLYEIKEPSDDVTGETE